MLQQRCSLRWVVQSDALQRARAHARTPAQLPCNIPPARSRQAVRRALGSGEPRLVILAQTYATRALSVTPL